MDGRTDRHIFYINIARQYSDAWWKRTKNKSTADVRSDPVIVKAVQGRGSIKVGRICWKGRFWAWSKRAKEWWMMRVVMVTEMRDEVTSKWRGESRHDWRGWRNESSVEEWCDLENRVRVRSDLTMYFKIYNNLFALPSDYFLCDNSVRTYHSRRKCEYIIQPF